MRRPSSTSRWFLSRWGCPLSLPVSRPRRPLSRVFEGTKLSERLRAAPLLASGSASFHRSSPNSVLCPPVSRSPSLAGALSRIPCPGGGAPLPRTPLSSAGPSLNLCAWDRISLSERWSGDGDLRSGSLLRRGGTFVRWERRTECRIRQQRPSRRHLGCNSHGGGRGHLLGRPRNWNR